MTVQEGATVRLGSTLAPGMILQKPKRVVSRQNEDKLGEQQPPSQPHHLHPQQQQQGQPPQQGQEPAAGEEGLN